MNISTEVRYTPSTREDVGCLRALRLFIRDVRRHWPQISVSMYNDWIGIYKGSYLGAFWAVIMAIVPMSVFILLSILRIFPSRGEMPRAVYIAAGITIWMVVAETITMSIGNVRSAARTLSGAQDPLVVGLMSRYGLLLSDTLIRFSALVVWMLVSGLTLRWSLLLFPVLIIPVWLFAAGLGLILAAFNVVVPDVSPLTGMVLRYAIFFSFAIFELPDLPWVRHFMQFNIPGQFVVGVREAIVLGRIDDPVPFAMACVVGVIVFLLGLRTFYRLEPHMVERI